MDDYEFCGWCSDQAAKDARDEITALRARLDAVEKDQLGMVKRYDAMTRRVEQSEARAERAEAALATARRDALLEAAKVVDARKSILEVGTELSSRIRALANEAPE